MKKSILNLGKPLNKIEQKNIFGGSRIFQEGSGCEEIGIVYCETDSECKNGTKCKRGRDISHMFFKNWGEGMTWPSRCECDWAPL